MHCVLHCCSAKRANFKGSNLQGERTNNEGAASALTVLRQEQLSLPQSYPSSPTAVGRVLQNSCPVLATTHHPMSRTHRRLLHEGRLIPGRPVRHQPVRHSDGQGSHQRGKPQVGTCYSSACITLGCSNACTGSISTSSCSLQTGLQTSMQVLQEPLHDPALMRELILLILIATTGTRSSSVQSSPAQTSGEPTSSGQTSPMPSWTKHSRSPSASMQMAQTLSL
jgi:hypothetical protein